MDFDQIVWEPFLQEFGISIAATVLVANDENVIIDCVNELCDQVQRCLVNTALLVPKLSA